MQEEARQQEAAKLQEEVKRQEEVKQKEEAKRLEEAKLQDEAKRTEEAKRQEEAKLQEEAQTRAEVRLLEESKRKTSKDGARKLSGTQSPSARPVDFNVEARKSALILGCSAVDLKVTGMDGKNILYSASCSKGASLALSCDPSGLCLKK